MRAARSLARERPELFDQQRIREAAKSERNAKILADLRDGLPAVTIAAKWSIGSDTVKKIGRAVGVKMSHWSDAP